MNEESPLKDFPPPPSWSLGGAHESDSIQLFVKVAKILGVLLGLLCLMYFVLALLSLKYDWSIVRFEHDQVDKKNLTLTLSLGIASSGMFLVLFGLSSYIRSANTISGVAFDNRYQLAFLAFGMLLTLVMSIVAVSVNKTKTSRLLWVALSIISTLNLVLFFFTARHSWTLIHLVT